MATLLSVSKVRMWRLSFKTAYFFIAAPPANEKEMKDKLGLEKCEQTTFDAR